MSYTDELCQEVFSYPSFLVGFMVAILAVIMVKALISLKSSFNRRRLHSAGDRSNNLTPNLFKSYSTPSRVPAFTTATTVPKHAISDMDRDIECQMLRQGLKHPYTEIHP